MDSSATLDMPVTGYGILYRHGLFKQVFDNGYQVETPDVWMEDDFAPVVPHRDEKQRIELATGDVYAVPYDLSLIHISEPTRRTERSRMPSSA